MHKSEHTHTTHTHRDTKPTRTVGETCEQRPVAGADCLQRSRKHHKELPHVRHVLRGSTRWQLPESCHVLKLRMGAKRMFPVCPVIVSPILLSIPSAPSDSATCLSFMLLSPACPHLPHRWHRNLHDAYTRTLLYTHPPTCTRMHAHT